MPEMREIALGSLGSASAQASELALLVELEARWENLRMAPSRSREAGSVTHGLTGIQKAYDAFHSKLVAYNKRFTPDHVPELLLNNPSRLGRWCRAMRDLYLAVEHDPQFHCPVQLLEKADRCAQRLSARLNKDCAGPCGPPRTVRAAIERLGALAQWCADLAGVAAGE
jgi:hypothetical protein